MTSPRLPFPHVINSSFRTDFVACPQKAYLQNVAHWKAKNLSVHLLAGGAYAEGLEVARKSYYDEHTDAETAIAQGLHALLRYYGTYECPPESAKSLERMLGALEYYFHEYPLGVDAAHPASLPGGRTGVEFSFAEPIDILHPETGQPLIYCGRMDMVADYAGALYGEDDKTTSRLGASWGNQWDLRAQFTAYTWACQQAGIPLAGFLVRGISILKTKYETQQAITYRHPWMVERWYKQLLRDVNSMIECWKEDYWDYNLDDSCNAYGGCPFKKVCTAVNPEAWLKVDFERRVRDPLTRTEMPFDEWLEQETKGKVTV